MGFVILSFLTAIIATGLVLLTTRFRFAETHWLLILLCVVLTTFSLFIAFLSHRFIRSLDTGTEILVSYKGILSPLIEDSWIATSAGQASDAAFQTYLPRLKMKLRVLSLAGISCGILTNLLLWLILKKNTAGKSTPRRASARMDSHVRIRRRQYRKPQF